jgi:hypothetical protein
MREPGRRAKPRRQVRRGRRPGGWAGIPADELEARTPAARSSESETAPNGAQAVRGSGPRSAKPGPSGHGERQARGRERASPLRTRGATAHRHGLTRGEGDGWRAFAGASPGPVIRGGRGPSLSGSCGGAGRRSRVVGRIIGAGVSARGRPLTRQTAQRRTKE